MAILLLVLVNATPGIMRSNDSATFAQAAQAAIQRLFANPASTVENLFYFGFLAERLSHCAGRRLTPLLIGFMYMAHEMTNPEYWYEQVSFGMIFAGIVIWAAIYLWRRSVIIIWLGDGFGRMLGMLV